MVSLVIIIFLLEYIQCHHRRVDFNCHEYSNIHVQYIPQIMHMFCICCVLLCLGANLFYRYSLSLFHWHWENCPSASEATLSWWYGHIKTKKRTTLIARFMGPTWGPSGADRTQVGPMLVPWTLLSGNENASLFYGIYCMSGVFCQKKVSRTRTSNYIPQYLWDVITCRCPWYLLLAQHSWYETAWHNVI